MTILWPGLAETASDNLDESVSDTDSQDSKKPRWALQPLHNEEASLATKSRFVIQFSMLREPRKDKTIKWFVLSTARRPATSPLPILVDALTSHSCFD